MPRFYKFVKHEMVTKVVLIDIDDPRLNDKEALEEAWRLWENRGDKYPVIKTVVTKKTSHVSGNDISFWRPGDLPKDVMNY